MRKSASIENIKSGFKKSGVVPVNRTLHLSSEFAMQQNTQDHDAENLLKNYWLNSNSSLAELFQKENGRMPNEEDYTLNLRKIYNDLKSASIEEGKALSTLPLLVCEDGSEVIMLE